MLIHQMLFEVAFLNGALQKNNNKNLILQNTSYGSANEFHYTRDKSRILQQVF